MTALLQVDHVGRSFSGGLFSRRRTRAVADVDFTLSAEQPEVFAVIGESGSGKTTLARMVLAMTAPSEGAIRFQGRDLREIRSRRDRLDFMRHVQPIFQNPFEAFNPLKRVDRYLYAAAARFRGAATRVAAEAMADEALHQVGLSLAEVKGRFPHELSGGQLQRTAIARALIPRPALIVADEPVSMIDASLRMTVTNLFRTLRDELRVSIIYITHDLATAYYVSDRVIVMRQGEVVESGAAEQVLTVPRHPYSKLLKDSVLSIDGAWAGDALRSHAIP
ncbi:ABC transporter ATP-binding protein [Paracraurococcus lichenis]|uniref:ABC transporter ATP-binding protein n=1 Tax=Paracraurococcus lichenis TaxID=3064888 RepID=A0ABT9E941_9PROT|nr:ABC transporter ATP-binding protein [Paracraurococcus sp. LOR1-02]MDO9712704.1 ABC transporter ATP-binding protein [Paracraurococcus sp. LOR1-02]